MPTPGDYEYGTQQGWVLGGAFVDYILDDVDLLTAEDLVSLVAGSPAAPSDASPASPHAAAAVDRVFSTMGSTRSELASGIRTATIRRASLAPGPKSAAPATPRRLDAVEAPRRASHDLSMHRRLRANHRAVAAITMDQVATAARVLVDRVLHIE